MGRKNCTERFFKKNPEKNNNILTVLLSLLLHMCKILLQIAGRICNFCTRLQYNMFWVQNKAIILLAREFSVRGKSISKRRAHSGILLVVKSNCPNFDHMSYLSGVLPGQFRLQRSMRRGVHWH